MKDSPMKILAITASYPPHHAGGYELRCRNVIEGLRIRGHDIRLITTHCPEKNCNLHTEELATFRYLHEKSQATSFFNRIQSDLLDLKFIDHLFTCIEPDIIYLSHLGDLSNAIVPYISRKEIPAVLDDGGLGSVLIARSFRKMLYFNKGENDTRTRRNLKKFFLLLINWFSKGLINSVNTWPNNLSVIYNSLASKRYAEMNNIHTSNAGLIYSGIDLSTFIFKPRPKLNNPIQIIVPGRICREKGTKDAVKLMSLLKDFQIPAKLTIVGKIGSIEYYEEMRNEIKSENLDNILVLDMIDQDKLTSLYLQSDICFFPSYQKYGLSRTPLEAMACGCVLITYGNEGSDEIVQHRVTGYVIPEGDIYLVAKTIKEQLLQSDDAYSMTLRARSLVENRHSLDQYIDQIENYLLSRIPHTAGIYG